MQQDSSLQRDKTFELLVESVKDYAILMLDTAGNVLTWNRGAQEKFGYKSNEIIGKHISVFYHNSNADHTAQELQIAIQTGHFEERAWRRRKDGSAFWANVVITPLYDHAKVLQGFAKVIHDLTQEKIFEEYLSQAHTEAIEANKAKSLFIANIAHELRTSLAGVIGMSEMLLQSPDIAGDDQLAVEHIFSSAKRLSSTLNNVLAFSKIEAGKLFIHNSTICISSVISEIYNSFNLLAEQSGLCLTYALAPDCPQALSGDESKLYHVLANLVHNALKFTPRGSVTISCQVVEKNKDKAILRFAVIDTGIGIKSEVQENIFEPFVQTGNMTKKGNIGTGLGLSIAKSFVVAMGGEIGVTSSEGQGTTFWFLLPFEIVN